MQTMISSARRGPLHPAITEETVAKLVDRFYGRIRSDEELGPVFRRVIGEDWGPHLEKMRDFWSSVTMMTGRYKGTPFEAHRRIGGLTQAHFARWLSIWDETVRRECAPDVAAIFNDRARRIAGSLQLGLLYRAADDDPQSAQDDERRSGPAQGRHPG